MKRRLLPLLALPLLAAPLLALAGCAAPPSMVLVNRHTGATVNCQAPDPTAGSGGFLISRACLSACQAHGFRPVPDLRAAASGDDIPDACTN